MRDKILQLLSLNDDLPPLPEILIHLEKLVNDPKADLESIAELVESDPVLSGKLIALANSVLVGGGRDKAEDLGSAVMRLGIKMILDLAYTLKLSNMFIKLPQFDQLQFWKHTFSVALLSQALAIKLELSKREQEVSYVAGLMHDIGILVFFHLIPEEYIGFTKKIKRSEEALASLEEAKFGIDHSALGGKFILTKWPVSAKISKSAKLHLQGISDIGESLTIPQIVSLADRIASGYGASHQMTACEVKPLEKALTQALKLDENDIRQMMENVLESVNQAESILKG
jgi:HD-like signal output (HDOD) protein